MGGMGGMGSSPGLGLTAPKPQRFEDGLATEYGDMSAMIPTMRSMLKMTYTIHMPADIVEATPQGKLSEDKRSITYDVFDLYEKKQPIVLVAREENALMKYAAFGAAGLAVLAIAGLLYFKFALKR